MDDYDSDNEQMIGSRKRSKAFFLEDEDDIVEEANQENGLDKGEEFNDGSDIESSEKITATVSKKRVMKFLQSSDESSDSENETTLQPSSNYSKVLMTADVAAAAAVEQDDEKDISLATASKQHSTIFPDSSNDSSDPENEETIQQPSPNHSNRLVTAGDVASAVERDSDEEATEKKIGSDQVSSSDDSSDDDDDAPPIRIFRNPNAAASQARGVDNGSDSSEDEGIGDPPLSPTLPPNRRAKRVPLPSTVDIKSETQRLIRESRVNLPYHVPEPKKLSQLLKRSTIYREKSQTNTPKVFTKNDEIPKFSENVPKLSDNLSDLNDDVPQLSDDKRDSGVEVLDSPKQDRTNERPVSPKTDPEKKPLSRKAMLLARIGDSIPTLHLSTVETSRNPTVGFVDLDSELVESKQNNKISSFMERFYKHSSLEKISLQKKKVQFNIIKKEERPDGSGVELVPDVVTVAPDPEQENKDQVDDYKTLRAKLEARMKQKRFVERLKRQELYKLDNEEIGNEEEEEEEEEDWTDPEDSEEEGGELERMEDNTDASKNNIIEDDDEDDELLERTQPVFCELSESNVAATSDASQHTLRSDSMSSHLTREGSMLLFEDTTRKSSCIHDLSQSEFSAENQTLDPLYSSTIPPNKIENSDVSNSSRVHRLNSDEDSYFCSERSINNSLHSPSRPEYESQFFDSNGFIRESEKNKSIGSLLPPGGEDDNANDGNMSQLLELCSGKFQVSEIDPPVSDAESEADVNGAFIDESFGFQVEAGSFDHQKEDKFSDTNNSDDDEDDEQITIVRKKKNVTAPMIKNFLEDEAELSGDDVGSDEDDDNEGDKKEDYYEVEENDEELPKEEIIQQQVNKVHLRQLLDDDQRDIDLLQEAFVTDNVEVRRNRKFRWKNIDDNVTQDLFHSDDDDDDDPSPDDTNDAVGMGDEESQWRMMRLEREEYLNSNTENKNPEIVDIEEDSQLFRMGKIALRNRRIFSEINEDSNTNTSDKLPTLLRSSSLTTPKSLPSRNSFLTRKPEILSKFANFKEASVIKGAVNSDRMVFKAVSPSKKNVRVKRPAAGKQSVTKKPRVDEDSNSIFNLFEV